MLQFESKSDGTSLRNALNFINHVHTRRAIVFLVSDFLDAGFERTLKITARHHDLIPIVVADVREQSLPDVGWLVVEDAETGELVEVNSSDCELRAAFAAAARQRVSDLRHLCRRMGTDLIELATDAPFVQPIQQFMERRIRQHGRSASP